MRKKISFFLDLKDMAYGYKRYRRYRKSRSNRLSTRRVFSKTSAKAQASQINTLRKRINYVSRQCRPETKVLNGAVLSKTFDSQTLLNTYWAIPGPLVNLGSEDNQRIGDKINIKNVQFTFTAEYYNNSQTGYHGSESAGTTMRIIIGQFKTPRSYDVVPSISDVLSQSSNTGAVYTHQAVIPLKNGITEQYNILKDMKFVMTSSNNQRLIKFNVKPRSFRYTSKEEFNNIWIMIITAGLHNDTDFSEFVEMSANIKMVYTDA